MASSDAEMSGKRPREEEDNASVLAKLAKRYDERVSATQARLRSKGLPAAPEADDDCEYHTLKEVVEKPKAVLPTEVPFHKAPTLTLREMMPGQYKQGDLNQPRLDVSFRTDKIEFVLMSRKKEAEKEADKEWDLPTREVFNEAMLM